MIKTEKTALQKTLSGAESLRLLPSLIMLATKEKVQRIAVVDRSGIVLPYLTDSETARYTDYSAFDADSVKAGLDDLGMDGMLVISPLAL